MITTKKLFGFLAVSGSGWRVVRLGGVASNGANAGAFYVSADDASGAASRAVSGRLAY
jgi:hypothetical protein